MHPNHAARPNPSRTGFTPETWGISAVTKRQLVFRQDFLAMNVGHGGFCRWNQIQFSQRACIQALLHPVILIDKLRELSDSLQTLRTHHEWRRDLRVSVLGRV